MYEVATQQSGEMVSRNTQTEMMISRQAQEVQGAMVIAKRFPRDEVESFNRIMQSCKRKSLAESAMYEYPRGGNKSFRALYPSCRSNGAELGKY